MDDGAAKLLGQHVGQHGIFRPKADAADTIRRALALHLAAEDAVAVFLMHHGHVMAPRRQRARHPLHADGVAAEGMGRVEGGEHDDGERAHETSQTSGAGKRPGAT